MPNGVGGGHECLASRLRVQNRSAEDSPAVIGIPASSKAIDVVAATERLLDVSS